jgi:hypothetical protein
VAAGVPPQLNEMCVVVDSQRFARVEERPESTAQYLVRRSACDERHMPITIEGSTQRSLVLSARRATGSNGFSGSALAGSGPVAAGGSALIGLAL